MFCKKGVLKNFTKFTEKHLSYSLFFNKVAGLVTGLRTAKQTLARVFLWTVSNFSEHLFYRTPLVATSGALHNLIRQNHIEPEGNILKDQVMLILIT